MTLAHGRQYLAIPGPSVMPDRVLQAMHRAAPNIYTGELHDMVGGMIPDLRALARTRHNVAIYIANGHGAWDASLANTVNRGERVLVLATGRFGLGWGDAARGMGIETETLDFGKQSTIDPDQLSAALAAPGAEDYKAVLMVQTDTSTSVKNDVQAVRAALDTAGHPALLMVDCMASLGCDPFEMDDWGVDVMVAGCQKGLMTPPGLGFVFFNDRAAAQRETVQFVPRYWDWKPRADPQEFYQYFGGTAATHHAYGLRAALDMISEEGLENVWSRHATLARAVWAAAEIWGAEGPIRLNIADPALRAHSVTAFRTGMPYGRLLRDWVTENAGVTLGIGVGMNTPEDPRADGYFRIGHMGHVNAHMILGVLGVIEAGLIALDIPHGQGAVAAAAKVCAAHPAD